MIEPSGRPPTLTDEEVASLQKRKFYTQRGLVWCLLLTVIIGGYFKLDGLIISILALGCIGLMLMIKCPRCERGMMLYRGSIEPRSHCPHCNWPETSSAENTIAGQL
jgi:hypothetical protein